MIDVDGRYWVVGDYVAHIVEVVVAGYEQVKVEVELGLGAEPGLVKPVLRNIRVLFALIPRGIPSCGRGC